MHRYIVAIDQGTTGSRVMVVDQEGCIVASAYSEFPQIYPQPGWVEHNPEVIWDITCQVLGEALAKAALAPQDIAGIGITNQRETVVLWDKKTLRPVHNAIVWQCRRSAAICDELKSQGLEDLFRAKTGLILDAYFSGTKVKWLLDRDPALLRRARAGEIALGTIDAWLIARLTGGRVHATDYTNASRTLMYNIHERRWDCELLEILGIPEAMLPQVVPSCGVVGESDPRTCDIEAPICGIAGDQQAALFGQGCFHPGEAKNTYGTGCFLLRNMGQTRAEPSEGLLLTLACNARGGPCYALEGSVFIAGAVVQWLRDGLGLIASADKTGPIAASVEDTHGVYMVPAFAGLGAPYWDMYARGSIQGLTRSSTKAHIIRAALEGIAYQVTDLAGAFEDSTHTPLGELKVDGGASRNDFPMQFQADMLGCPVDRSAYIESTGMGAAFLAGLACGLWKSTEELSALRRSERVFTPQMDAEHRSRLYTGWKDAVARVRSSS